MMRVAAAVCIICVTRSRPHDKDAGGNRAHSLENTMEPLARQRQMIAEEIVQRLWTVDSLALSLNYVIMDEQDSIRQEAIRAFSKYVLTPARKSSRGLWNPYDNFCCLPSSDECIMDLCSTLDLWCRQLQNENRKLDMQVAWVARKNNYFKPYFMAAEWLSTFERFTWLVPENIAPSNWHNNFEWLDCHWIADLGAGSFCKYRVIVLQAQTNAWYCHSFSNVYLLNHA